MFFSHGLDVDDILRRQSRMEAERANFETLWREIADVMLPRQADFLGSAMMQGGRRTDRIYDETAMLALDHGVAVFEGEVIPQGGQWQMLQARDVELMRNMRVRLWFEKLTGLLFQLRNSPYSGFANQTHESIASLLSFGLQGMWPDFLLNPFKRRVGLSYRSEHIGQLFIQENHRGEVDIIHRKFTLTNRQAAGKWGDRVPECVARGMRDNRPDDTNIFLHVIQPNHRVVEGRMDAAGKPFASVYVAMADKQIFDEGGYRTRRLIASRYEKSPTETYGRSPAMNVLPAVKASQAIMVSITVATELMGEPPLLAHDDMLDQLIQYAPRGITYGGLSERGEPMIRKLLEGVDLTQPMLLQERTRQVIQRAFFEDLYQVRREVKTHVSATEIMEREKEKGILLAPLQRQQTEWFTPQTEVELDLMADMGMLDDMPPELIEAGGMFQIGYENPLTRARKADQAAGFYQMLNGVTPLIQMDQENVREFLERYPFAKVLAGLGAIHGVPASWENDDATIASIRTAKAQEAATASALEVGDKAAGIAQTLASAGAAAA